MAIDNSWPTGHDTDEEDREDKRVMWHDGTRREQYLQCSIMEKQNGALKDMEVPADLTKVVEDYLKYRALNYGETIQYNSSTKGKSLT